MIQVVVFLKCVKCGKVKKHLDWVYLTKADFLRLRANGYTWDYQFVECPNCKKQLVEA